MSEQIKKKFVDRRKVEMNLVNDLIDGFYSLRDEEKPNEASFKMDIKKMLENIDTDTKKASLIYELMYEIMATRNW